jgi:hypothetical protein
LHPTPEKTHSPEERNTPTTEASTETSAPKATHPIKLFKIIYIYNLKNLK